MYNNIKGGIFMNERMQLLKLKAEQYRDLYRLGKITREEAKNSIMPYLDEVNSKGREIAKKYNRKYRNITFSTFVR